MLAVLDLDGGEAARGGLLPTGGRSPRCDPSSLRAASLARLPAAGGVVDLEPDCGLVLAIEGCFYLALFWLLVTDPAPAGSLGNRASSQVLRLRD